MNFLLGLHLALSPVTQCGEIALILEEGVEAGIINQQDLPEVLARCLNSNWENSPAD